MNPSKKLTIAALLLARLLPAIAAEATAPASAPAVSNSPPITKAKKQRAPLPPLPISTVASPARTKDNVEFIIGPDYAFAPEMTARDHVPKGKVHEFTMSSVDSAIFTAPQATPVGATPPTSPTPYQRYVWVYVPNQYVAGTPAPLLLSQDGGGRQAFLPTILDNMIHDKRLPVMIAVMVNSGAQRDFEYRTMSDVYAGFIENEVLPRITKDYGVTFTKDPAARATMGGSAGGIAAFTMAWFRPDLFRRVLSYSGSFVDASQRVPNPAFPRGGSEYHEHLIANTPHKPLRVWLEVSDQDGAQSRLANRGIADALKAKGYAYRYVFAEAAQHNDSRVTRQTLPGALEWLWADYKAK